jgi:hypothetical protein
MAGWMFSGRFLRTGENCSHSKNHFLVLLTASFPMYGFVAILFDLMPSVNIRDNAANSLLIVELAAFCSCRKVMYAVTLSPVISTAR